MYQGGLNQNTVSYVTKKDQETRIQDRGIVIVWEKNYREGLPGEEVKLRRSSNNEWNFQRGVRTVTS